MSLTNRALNHIWFPCSQVKDYESLPPIEVAKAQGSYFTLTNGERVIDGTSSWWCKSLGHQHPEIKEAISQQLNKFEHIIGTNTVNETIVQLSEKLAKLTRNLDKIFYASDGSMAVEIALKMCIHARLRQNQPNKTKFIALANGYHGETIATLSVSDCGLYKAPYESYCFDTVMIENLPYVSGTDDPTWENADDAWTAIRQQLLPHVDETTAIIFEPLVQGAEGMRVYSKDFLVKLREFANEHDIYLIADEIMTGLGRTGKMLAIDHAGIEVDFLCLSKALTGGSLPMSVMLTSNDIYQLFYDDYETHHAFMHSNTHFGNALAASAAVCALTIYERDAIPALAHELGKSMRSLIEMVAKETNVLSNIRSLGAMVACDINLPIKRVGFAFFKEALQRGAFIRPIDNNLYWLPPLNTDKQTLEKLANITIEALITLKNS